MSMRLRERGRTTWSRTCAPALELTPAELAELDALRPAGNRVASEGETNRVAASVS
ncbi:MAG: hypothetical protein QOC75_3668 [Pseudonocardiales bacterium]|nr:hypothetical protein [Pseudonocardiales bacterium]